MCGAAFCRWGQVSLFLWGEVMKNGDISARLEPLVGWVAQIYVEALKNWFDISGSLVFRNPDDACRWGISATRN